MVAGTAAEVAVAYVACGDDGAIVTYQATTVAGAGYFAVGGVTAGQSNISLRGFTYQATGLIAAHCAAGGATERNGGAISAASDKATGLIIVVHILHPCVLHVEVVDDGSGGIAEESSVFQC